MGKEIVVEEEDETTEELVDEEEEEEGLSVVEVAEADAEEKVKCLPPLTLVRLPVLLVRRGVGA
jgi:hypothetical protein